MARSKTSTYVLTLKLNTEEFQENILNKRLEIARNISNSLTNVVLKRYNLMLESKEYNKIKNQLKPANKSIHDESIKVSKETNKLRKELYNRLNDIYTKYNLTQYSLYADVKPMYKHFKDNIGSLECQAIADRVWSKFDKLLFGKANRVCFDKFGEYNTIENKWNKSGLKYSDGFVIWNGLKIPVVIKQNDIYAQTAIQDNIKFCRIVRKIIRGKYKYYVQLMIEGIPPIKINKDTGEIKNPVGNDNVGIDIGTRTIAYSSSKEVKLLELCPEVENIEHKKAILQRKLNRQRRTNNPNNYNENGTIKRGIKLVWIKSNKYIQTQNELREIQRKQACVRKQSHEKLANHILTLGDRILVETMQFQGLQKRAKNTTINKNGKINKKKRFGKSLANKAPAMLIEIINRKLKYNGLEILKINTQKVKASQYNHFIDDYNKKELSDRWNESIEIQRDIYSAFLIMNVNDDLETINKQLCNDTYDNFKILHDEEVNRLKQLKANGYKLISSMGI